MSQKQAGLVDRIDAFRAASRLLASERRAEMGQYLTPPPVARFMASLFSDAVGELRLLDAGAGVGTLTAAFVEDAAARKQRPAAISAFLYELDPALYGYLGATIEACGAVCRAHGIHFKGAAYNRDFIEDGVSQLRRDLFGASPVTYNRAILNPPYKKIHSQSSHRLLLREIGVETSNLYTGFLALVIQLLEPGGELVAITPRSFCNGPYFKPFRRLLLTDTAIRRLHVFETRDQAFGEDDVLQENVIFHVVKNGPRETVTVSRAHGANDDTLSSQELAYEEVVRPDDPDLVIHIPANGVDRLVRDRMSMFQHTLDGLGLTVSTGRVVEFRARNALRQEPEPGAAPLIYPHHLRAGAVHWPNGNRRKPEALAVAPETQELLVPSGYYVLVKRFSSKEERRRIVAAVFDPTAITAPQVGFENHINYFHAHGAGLPPALAAGLACYLNSTLIDAYFRQFSGHTQVNASDLRMLHYPSTEALARLGLRGGQRPLQQAQIDALIEEELLDLTEEDALNPITVKQKVEEALAVLRAVGMPRAQLNERSALTLLALLDLKPLTPWASARSRMIGITPIMDFCRQHYGTSYAPNTRETFRRQTMHQFVEAGLVVANPDDPDRAVNSPKWCYQVASAVLKMAQDWPRPDRFRRTCQVSLARTYKSLCTEGA